MVIWRCFQGIGGTASAAEDWEQRWPCKSDPSRVPGSGKVLGKYKRHREICTRTICTYIYINTYIYILYSKHIYYTVNIHIIFIYREYVVYEDP